MDRIRRTQQLVQRRPARRYAARPGARRIGAAGAISSALIAGWVLLYAYVERDRHAPANPAVVVPVAPAQAPQPMPGTGANGLGTGP